MENRMGGGTRGGKGGAGGTKARGFRSLPAPAYCLLPEKWMGLQKPSLSPGVGHAPGKSPLRKMQRSKGVPLIAGTPGALGSSRAPQGAPPCSWPLLPSMSFTEPVPAGWRSSICCRAVVGAGLQKVAHGWQEQDWEIGPGQRDGHCRAGLGQLVASVSVCSGPLAQLGS